jgi:hypothetical protein
MKSFKHYLVNKFIPEGVRSGARDIKGYKPKKEFTVGFEFEIATPDLSDDDDNGDSWEEFSQNWFDNNDVSDWDYWDTLSKRDKLEIIDNYGLKPIYGYGKRDDYDERQGFLDFYEPTEEDSEDADKVRHGIVLDAEGDEVNLLSIKNPEEFFDLFKPNKYDRWREDYYYEYEQEQMDDAYREYLDNNKGKGSSVSYIQEVMSKALRTNIEIDSNDYSEWTLVKDSSIRPSGAELRSPVLSHHDAINALRTVFNTIKQDSELETNDSTGLHVNIGTFTKEEVAKLDVLKFSLLVGEDHVLSMFDRGGNDYTEPHIEHVIQYLKQERGFDFKDYEAAIESINRKIIRQGAKYRFANIGKLSEGYIEIRAPGGEDYHRKFDEVSETINRVMKFLEIAMDPNAFRKEYLSKLYKLLGDRSENNIDVLPKNREQATAKSAIASIEKDIGRALGNKYFTFGNSVSGIIRALVELGITLKNNNSDPSPLLKHSIAIRNYMNEFKKSNPQLKMQMPEAREYVNRSKNEMDKRVHALIMGLLN